MALVCSTSFFQSSLMHSGSVTPSQPSIDAAHASATQPMRFVADPFVYIEPPSSLSPADSFNAYTFYEMLPKFAPPGMCIPNS
jgi:hypothetical protein